jgi:hypothetical protein
MLSDTTRRTLSWHLKAEWRNFLQGVAGVVRAPETG